MGNPLVKLFAPFRKIFLVSEIKFNFRVMLFSYHVYLKDKWPRHFVHVHLMDKLTFIKLTLWTINLFFRVDLFLDKFILEQNDLVLHKRSNYILVVKLLFLI